MIILGDMHAHVPYAMNKCNCKTSLEINEQGYMAELFMCYCSCIAVQIYNWQASYMYIRCVFVKEADGVVSYLEPSMEIVGG